MTAQKILRRKRIRRSIRRHISGTAERPRLSVFRSNRFIYAQLIDDVAGKTIASATSLSKKPAKTSLMKQAKSVGTTISEKAQKAGIKTVVFDRGGYLYHGRVKALAEAAREAGLKF